MTNQELANQLKTKDDCLCLICDVIFDYDGYRTADKLMELLDEIRDIAIHGLEIE